ncbi:MAG TPA: 30S ribosomal protein S12 methylthiotransferase RimO [Candidatus Hydrogenedentes bacterium]|nr:30S ribosomal protein S12 methylthiotransferase RimO [Candidatus Hydrogenedentota bacterium]
MRVGLVTLGCDKNSVDTEYLAALLEDAGHELSLDPEPDATGALDAVVITTCGFIADAKRQSVQAVVDWAERKREAGSPKRLLVAGCLAQRYADDLLKEIPEIDGIVGVGQFREIARMVGADEDAPRKDVHEVPSVAIYPFLRRKHLGGAPHAFLKISDGCNHACTFCSIPLMKGKLRSVDRDTLLREAEQLIAQGVREINLIAQDLTAYGRDTGDKALRLPALLRDLDAIDGDFWIRCLYCYPGGVTDEFLETLRDCPKIVPYLDMPLQHLDPTMLRLMKRPYRAVNTFELVGRLRDAVPGIALRTTMIVGFPGETARAHDRMLEGLGELAFNWVGVFAYSREEDTPAATMPHQTRDATRARRKEAVLELQAQITAMYNRDRVRGRARVLVERFDPERGQWIGRTAGEAPEIDGCVYVHSPEPLRVGEFVEIEIVDADVFDVSGRVQASRHPERSEGR